MKRLLGTIGIVGFLVAGVLVAGGASSAPVVGVVPSVVAPVAGEPVASVGDAPALVSTTVPVAEPAAVPVTVPVTAHVAAPVPAPVAEPAVVPAAAPVTAPGAPPRSICEIVHASNDTNDFYAVYGMTELPRGTVFLFALSYDGKIQEVPLVATAGSIVIGGVGYGKPGSYDDEGQTNFGNTSADMPSVPMPHGPVRASVTLNGVTLCTN
jgi:hypothetical protein